VQDIRRSLYFDNLIGGGETTNKAQNLKESATSILGEACFELHKWHSNEPALEINSQLDNEPEQSYAKEQLGVQKGETKLLGLPWDKREDTMGVTLPTESAEPTKRNILGTLAKIYDPLGRLISAVTLAGKTLYREACDLKNSWDEPLPETLQAKWKCWERSLPQKVQIPRSVTAHQEDIKAKDLHAFGDTSQKGVSTAAYTCTALFFYSCIRRCSRTRFRSRRESKVP
jgi:hypothetical protein